ncbi:hypothetical protein NUW54_g2616 [Trametes sanguinea]|uniref:Uncharacterized protein n=1 Tax=Trametes sanguinea TaxID=158606 RepID=A0ACC1Q673_9APHY|nr:hypothetical protein NUW54_g2616 [Trametes sanguinea]
MVMPNAQGIFTDPDCRDVEAAIKEKAHLLPWLEASDVKISQVLVYELAKVTWARFKWVFQAACNAEKQAALARNKCTSLKRAIELYKAEDDGRDPSPLLNVSMMSDEASGPEVLNSE